MTITDYIHIICKYFHITPTELRKKTRKKEYVLRRHLACKLIFRDNQEGKYAQSKYSARLVGNSLKLKHCSVVVGSDVFTNLITLYPNHEYAKHYMIIKSIIASKDQPLMYYI